MTREQRFNVLLKKYLKGDAIRIETDTMSGVPDWNVCYEGMEYWLEAKIAVGQRVAVRPEQVAWALRREAHGGRVYMCVRTARRTFFDPEVLIYEASQFQEVRDFGTSTTPLNYVSYPIDWELFNHFLLKAHPLYYG